MFRLNKLTENCARINSLKKSKIALKEKIAKF